MQFLLLILSVMTWTVESKNAVSPAEGSSAPQGVEAVYANTGDKGHVTDKDTATFTLRHLDGITIDSVEVYVRSNKSSGAGVFAVTVDGNVVATKSGSMKNWVGVFDNANYHSIRLLNNSYSAVNELVISLVGTDNSLYIEKYVIDWSPRPVRTVTLMNGVDEYGQLTENEGVSGVLLPNLENWAPWTFVGWGEKECWTTYTKPQIYSPGTKYYPAEDCTLWAVYVYEETPETGYATELVSGEYMYVNTQNNMALNGVPVDGRMSSEAVDDENEQLLYYVDFQSETTAYITHVATNTSIGFTGTQMAARASLWSVYHEGTTTVFYTVNGGKNYVLWLNCWDGTVYAGLQGTTTALSQVPTAIRAPRVAGEAAYTCHPECGVGIEETNEEVSAQSEKRIINGQLYIICGEKHFNAQGQLMNQ